MKNKNTQYTTTDLIRLFEEVSQPENGYSSTGAYRALGCLSAIIDGYLRYGKSGVCKEVYDLQNQLNRTCQDLEKELAKQTA